VELDITERASDRAIGGILKKLGSRRTRNTMSYPTRSERRVSSPFEEEALL
jgi:hypothetical protein